MRVRQKLLLLLLAIAILPLMAVSYYGQLNTRRLGRDVAGRARGALATSAAAQLRLVADDCGKIIRSEKELVELSVRLQALLLERLDSAAGREGSPVLTFARDFDRGEPLPKGTARTSERHVRVREDGQLEPMAISFDAVNLLLAPGVEKDDVRSDLRCLASAAPVFQRVRFGNEERFLWQYACTENGVHASFPGHGGYPETYDPRRRTWYESAESAGDTVWSPPLVDATSRQVLLTCSTPFRLPGSGVAGVTAIDIRMVDLLARVRMPAGLSSKARALLTNRRERENGGGIELCALASHDYLGSKGNSWDVPVEMECFRLDAWPFRKMVADLESRVSGVVRMPFRGQESLWAYGPIDERGLDIVIVVPWTEVVAGAVDLEEEVLDRTGEHLITTAGIFLVVVAIVVLAASWIARSVTRPVRRLTGVARQVAGGNLDIRADINTGDELQELADTLDLVLPYLRDRVEIKSALNLAKEVQQNLLPKAPPWVTGLDISGRSIYCDETGGDYYDYFSPELRGPGKLAIAVGDVAGHGIGPALLMATARALIKSRVRRERHLFEICGEVNRELSEDADAGRFMTLFLMEVDAPGHLVRWICAGHDHALLYDPAEDRFIELGGEDIALGIERDWQYREHSHGGLAGGEVIFIGTDGIPETRNARGEFFGARAVRRIIRENHARGAAALVDLVTRALAEFRGARAQEDDVTLVVVRMLEEEGR